ncbi:MAG: hypothetical protein J7M26_03810, partial [Armatimonadetes bacterium]|nr:hypothetical protein [Armatimonadota bacterium]
MFALAAVGAAVVSGAASHAGPAAPEAASRADPSLIAYWPLDEVVGSVTPDVSGHGHDAVVKGEQGLPKLVDGLIGKALLFDAQAQQWLEVKPSAALDPAKGLTVMAWIKPAARNKAYAIVNHKGDRSG